MNRNDDHTAVLLEGASSTELGLAKNLLAEAGIPCVVQGPDFDVAELGAAAHQSVRGGDLLVPRSALEKARELLEAAWGPPDGEGETES